MTEENLDKLVINYLTEEQYEELKKNGEINENELYCTPDNDKGIERVLFTGELKGDETLSLDVNKYKRLRVYATFNTYVNVVYEIDLENPFELVHLSGYSHGSSGLCQATDAPQIIYISSLYVSKDKKTLYHHKIGYVNGGSWADRGVNSGTNYKYYIYKIVGISNVDLVYENGDEVEY